jgi:hypothetical protein
MLRLGDGAPEPDGLASFASLICGYPGETEVSVMNTINFIEETAPTFFNVQLYYHDVRAPIQKMAGKFGIQGGGYSWSHNTMDWREAADWAAYMFRNITNSIPLPLYAFSMWGVSYLEAKGFTLEQVKEFGRITRPPAGGEPRRPRRRYRRSARRVGATCGRRTGARAGPAPGAVCRHFRVLTLAWHAVRPCARAVLLCL